MATRIIHAFPARPAPRAPFSVRQGWTAFVQMWRTRQTRRMLAEMDSRLLADIGASPADAHMEANRAFWDIESRR